MSSHFWRYTFFAVAGFDIAFIVIGLLSWLILDRPEGIWTLIGGVCGLFCLKPIVDSAAAESRREAVFSEEGESNGSK